MLVSLGIGVLLVNYTARGCRMSSGKFPNVVVIVIDTLRADHLPFYHYRKNTAPFLSRLSSQGVVFDRASSTSS